MRSLIALTFLVSACNAASSDEVTIVNEPSQVAAEPQVAKAPRAATEAEVIMLENVLSRLAEAPQVVAPPPASDAELATSLAEYETASSDRERQDALVEHITLIHTLDETQQTERRQELQIAQERVLSSQGDR